MTRRDFFSTSLKALCALPFLGVRGIDETDERKQYAKPWETWLTNHSDGPVSISFDGFYARVPEGGKCIVPRVMPRVAYITPAKPGMKTLKWSFAHPVTSQEGSVLHTAHSDRGKQ